MAIRPAMSSPFSEMVGAIMPLIRSWEMAEEMARSRPAAVDRAAARPPAPTRPTTQLGSLAISGLANTMMSWSILTSLALFGSSHLPGRICMMPSPFLSFQPTSPVFSQFLNQEGALTYSTLFTVLMKLVRAKTDTAGAVV